MTSEFVTFEKSSATPTIAKAIKWGAWEVTESTKSWCLASISITLLPNFSQNNLTFFIISSGILSEGVIIQYLFSNKVAKPEEGPEFSVPAKGLFLKEIKYPENIYL